MTCAGKRATPDVSLDASASAPMWAGRAAQTGETVNSGYVYGNRIYFRDITIGNNGALAMTGYDLVTGRGSWTG